MMTPAEIAAFGKGYHVGVAAAQSSGPSVMAQGRSGAAQVRPAAIRNRRPASGRGRPEAERLTPEERKIIEMLERSRGRALSKEEIRLSLEQARAIGEL